MNVQDLFNEDIDPEQMRQNLMNMLRAATSGQEATLDFGDGTVTLSYPEARFMAGKYRAYQKAGRQEEFIRAMGDARLFDRHMKQLRDLIDRQKNFRGSVPGERNVPGETTRPWDQSDFRSDAKVLASQLARRNPGDPVGNFVKGGKQLGIFKEQGVAEGVNAKQIKKDLDAGMSHDAVIGKHANKRMTNTDEIRRVIQQHAWEKRMKRPKEQGVAEDDPKSHQARTTLKHLKTQSYGDRADAANIKPGVKGFKDRYDMLQRAKALGNLKGDDNVSEGSTTKKKESGDITGTGRTERIMRQLRAQYPFAGSDIEALLYAFRSGQRRDRQDIDRLDRENDQEEAEIDDIERTLQKSGLA